MELITYSKILKFPIYTWWALRGSGGPWRALERYGQLRGALDSSDGLWWALAGSEGLWSGFWSGLWRALIVSGLGALADSGGIWGALEGFEGLSRALEGVGGLWRAL